MRACLPTNIKKLLVDGNSIWAYGLDSLLLVDNRSESIVLRMNDVPESQISCVKKSEDNNNLLYVSRDNVILLQDARKPS